jgi:putative FmdB family regulatory protein
MPLYEYECRDCGCQFEKIVRRPSDGELVRCPECDSESVQKSISLFGTVGVTTGGGLQDASCAPTGG